MIMLCTAKWFQQILHPVGAAWQIDFCSTDEQGWRTIEPIHKIRGTATGVAAVIRECRGKSIRAGCAEGSLPV
jgi:hypothetical protein